ncbi:MAG: chloride channel protein, partial [Polyangiaceae bacterium]
MSESHEANPISATGLLPVSPSLGPVLAAARVPLVTPIVGPRVLFISALAVGVAFVAGIVARVLMAMIAFVTNFAFLQRLSFEPVSPAQNHLGLLVIAVPAIGGIFVGLMARYGSKAIRGHGIPEAMEQVLTNESRIPPRLTFLKPLSAAIAIGTGGPFGAE